VPFLREYLKKDRKKLVGFSGLMVPSTKAIFTLINFKEKANLSGKMVVFIEVNGEIT
jgi:hypothetical protein